MSNRYINTASYYDAGNHRNFSEDIGFYKTYIKAGNKVLDIGCGTGRVALELVKEGISITGIDISVPMLEIFKQKIAQLPETYQNKIRFHLADMTDFNLEESFDLIVFPFRVFQALTSDEERRNCLLAIKKHLADYGLVIINLFDPDYELLKDFTSLNKIDYQFYDEQRKENIMRRTVGVSVDFDKQILKSKYIFEISDNNNHTQKIEELLELGFLNKKQLDELFTQHKFTIQNLYGWWDASPYNENLKRELIYVLGLE